MIGLDYDNTYTDDPVLFGEFIKLAQSRGHIVFVTTARNHDNIKDIQNALPELEIIASAGGPKRPATNAYGVSIDIWIDDMPEIIPGHDEWRLNNANH